MTLETHYMLKYIDSLEQRIKELENTTITENQALRERIAELEHQAKNDDDVIKHLSRENHRLLVDINQLQAPKSCDGCRNIGKLMDICCDCSRMWSDKFEPKDK